MLIRAGYKLFAAIYEHIYNEDFCDLSEDAKRTIWERDEFYRYDCILEADLGKYPNNIPFEINQDMPLSEADYCFYDLTEFEDFETFLDFEDEAQTESIENAVFYRSYDNINLIHILLIYSA